MKLQKQITGLCTCLVLILSTFTHAQTVLIDFGNDSSFRGASVVNPDENSHTWNSVYSGAFFANMVDIDNVATTIDFGFDSSPIPVGGTDYFNGPSGSTQDPTATVFNASALGSLGAQEAVYDYYKTSAGQIQGLGAGTEVQLTFYGSHKFNADNTTRYATYTDTDFTSVVDFADLVVGVGSAHNQDTTVSLNATANASGVVYFAWDGATTTGEGYLNAMSVTVIPEPSTFALFAVSALAGIIAYRRRK